MQRRERCAQPRCYAVELCLTLLLHCLTALAHAPAGQQGWQCRDRAQAWHEHTRLGAACARIAAWCACQAAHAVTNGQGNLTACRVLCLPILLRVLACTGARAGAGVPPCLSPSLPPLTDRIKACGCPVTNVRPSTIVNSMLTSFRVFSRSSSACGYTRRVPTHSRCGSCVCLSYQSQTCTNKAERNLCAQLLCVRPAETTNHAS